MVVMAKNVSQIAAPSAEQDVRRRAAKAGKRRTRTTGLAAAGNQRHVGQVAEARRLAWVAQQEKQKRERFNRNLYGTQAKIAAVDPAVTALSGLAAEVATAFLETWAGTLVTPAEMKRGKAIEETIRVKFPERPNAVTKGVRTAQAALTAAWDTSLAMAKEAQEELTSVA
jgi:hypothetical protein